MTSLKVWCLSHFRLSRNWDRSLKWRHNGRYGVPNHFHLICWLKILFSRTSKNTLKLRVTGLCEGNPAMTGAFRSQKAINAENVSIWWRHHVLLHSKQRHLCWEVFNVVYRPSETNMFNQIILGQCVTSGLSDIIFKMPTWGSNIFAALNSHEVGRTQVKVACKH